MSQVMLVSVPMPTAVSASPGARAAGERERAGAQGGGETGEGREVRSM